MQPTRGWKSWFSASESTPFPLKRLTGLSVPGIHRRFPDMSSCQATYTTHTVHRLLVPPGSVTPTIVFCCRSPVRALVWWSAWVFLFRWWWCLEFCRQTVRWSSSTISCRTTDEQCVTFRRGHPGLAILSDELQATDSLVPRTVPRLSAQANYTVPVTPQPGFFSEAMINHFQKIQQQWQTLPVGKSHQFALVPRSREALYSFLLHVFRGLPWHRSGLHWDFSIAAGGARLGMEQRYFRDFAAKTRRRLCISSFQDWTGAALNWSIQGPTDHVGIGNVSTENLLEQLKATLQLSQSVATAWSDLPTKLQLWHKVASRQRDNALYRDSAPFAVSKTRAAPHRSAPVTFMPWWHTHMPQPFLATRGHGSGCPFR